MIGVIIKIFLPGQSWHGRKLRQFILRVRRHRAINLSKDQYNGMRDNYYRHVVMNDCVSAVAKVSIIVPCFNTPRKYFEPLLASIFSQSYINWELVLVDASNQPESNLYLLEKAASDKRIIYVKTKNGGIAVNTNTGIATASGEYIAFLDHDDTLDPNALGECINLFAKNSNVGLVYTDEDKISDDGERYFEPHFKPGFSLDMLRNVNYITHFVVVKKSIVNKLNGIRPGFDGAQDYDFLLRVADENVVFGHVPKVLYHWRQADGSTAANFSNKKHVTLAGCRALSEHYQRNDVVNIKEVKAIANRPGFYRAHYNENRDNLKIVINLEHTRLLPMERKFILDQYKANRDIKKNKIKVFESSLINSGNDVLIVKGPFIPYKDTDIISLFALMREDGVSGVAPKITRHGRIYDMGIVNFKGSSMSLFHNLNPEKFRSFGSLEWVRNVDELSGLVQINSTKKSGRFIIWSHSEFIAFEPESEKYSNLSGSELYSPNIVGVTEIYEASSDYISDMVEIKE